MTAEMVAVLGALAVLLGGSVGLALGMAIRWRHLLDLEAERDAYAKALRLLGRRALTEGRLITARYVEKTLGEPTGT